MKEYFTDDYIKLINDSLENQIQRAVMHCGVWESTQNFFTSMDLGRQTGKTEAAVQLSKGLLGTVVYVGSSMAAANEFKSLGGKADVYTSKASDIDSRFRGHRMQGNHMTIIFDECDLRYNDMIQIANHAGLTLESNNWGKFVHIIRLGM